MPSCLCEYFMGANYFLLEILWVQTYSRGYFVGPKVFHGAALWEADQNTLVNENKFKKI